MFITQEAVQRPEKEERGSTELFGDESMGEMDGWSGPHLDGEKGEWYMEW